MRYISKRRFLKYLLAGTAGSFTLTNKGFGISVAQASLNMMQDNPLTLIKTTREAQFYTILSENRIFCELCPHGCILKPESKGICYNRINIQGKLYTIAYGNPCAAHIDPIEKKPLYHFMPGSKAFSIATAGCNLKCLNCQNWNISQTGADKTENQIMMPQDVVNNAIKYNCSSIAYTYSDPVAFYEYTYETSVRARQSGIKNLLISAGYINKEPLVKLAKYTDAANIDLKGFNNDTYKKLNGGSLKPVLDTLVTLKENNVWLEITNLIVPDWTDNLMEIKQMCQWLVNNNMSDVPLHFSRFVPMYKLNYLPKTPVSVLEKAHTIAKEAGLKYIYIGNVPEINGNTTYCHQCGAKLIDRKGYTILENKLTNGKCPNCYTSIDGIW